MLYAVTFFLLCESKLFSFFWSGSKLTNFEEQFFVELITTSVSHFSSEDKLLMLCIDVCTNWLLPTDD